jgi:hypothetical protein
MSDAFWHFCNSQLNPLFLNAYPKSAAANTHTWFDMGDWSRLREGWRIWVRFVCSCLLEEMTKVIAPYEERDPIIKYYKPRQEAQFSATLAEIALEQARALSWQTDEQRQVPLPKAKHGLFRNGRVTTR